MNANEAPDVGEAVRVFTGGALGTVLLLAVLLIAVATLVMPLVVVMINDKMRRMVLLMERQLEELRRLRRE
jgi:hypothetical protein